MVTWRDDPVTVGTRSFGYRQPYSPGHTPIPSVNGNVKRRTAGGAGGAGYIIVEAEF